MNNLFGKLIQGRAFVHVHSEAVVSLYILNGLSAGSLS